jgi:diaminopimelate decarboxylase
MSLPIREINEIKKITQDPFYVYDLKQIIENYEDFDSKLEIKNYFAIKALPNPHILRALYDEGYGNFDASSIEELELLKFAGIPLNKDNVFFTSNFSSREQIDRAAREGVIMNFDSQQQFEFSIQSGIIPKKFFFRLNPKFEVESSEDSNKLSGETTKFGIDEDDFCDVIDYAIQQIKIIDPENVDDYDIGVHCMSGSNVLNTTHWETLTTKLVSVWEKINSECDWALNSINLGGGIGIPYKPDDVKIDLELIRESINKLNTYYDNICMENGRYIAGPYGWYVTNLQSIKYNSKDEIIYGLNGSMADLMRPGMYGAYHHIDIYRGYQKLVPDCQFDTVHVVGTLCENNDWFAKNRNLSNDAHIGDTFIFSNSGAHCRAMGFNYNSKLRPQEFMIDQDGKIKKIRRSETFEDLVSTIVPVDIQSLNYNIIMMLILSLFVGIFYKFYYCHIIFG